MYSYSFTLIFFFCVIHLRLSLFAQGCGIYSSFFLRFTYSLFPFIVSPFFPFLFFYARFPASRILSSFLGLFLSHSRLGSFPFSLSSTSFFSFVALLLPFFLPPSPPILDMLILLLPLLAFFVSLPWSSILLYFLLVFSFFVFLFLLFYCSFHLSFGILSALLFFRLLLIEGWRVFVFILSFYPSSPFSFVISSSSFLFPPHLSIPFHDRSHFFQFLRSLSFYLAQSLGNLLLLSSLPLLPFVLPLSLSILS